MIRPLPQDTNRAVEAGLGECRNLGLILDKYQPWQKVPTRDGAREWDLGMAARLKRQGQWRAGYVKSGEARGHWFTGKGDDRTELVEPTLQPNDRIDELALKHFVSRWHVMVKAAGAEPFPMWTESPLIVGLGAKGTLEVALTLHPLYGFPYIPGSAVKGIARAAAFFALAERLGIEGVDNATYLRDYDNRERRINRPTPLQELARTLDEDARLEQAVKEWPDNLAEVEDAVREFRHLFGWRGGAGKAVFFDAMPEPMPKLVTEILTPHFFDYYSANEPPQDNQSPRPNTFLAAATGTKFHFAAGLRSGVEAKCLRDRAKHWLREGLIGYGLGGKTAAGYGYFLATEPKPTRLPVKRPEPSLSAYRQPETGGGSEKGRGGKTTAELIPESERTRSYSGKLEALWAQRSEEEVAKEDKPKALNKGKKKKKK